MVSTYKKVYNSIELDLEKRLIKLPKLKWVKIKGYRNKEKYKWKNWKCNYKKRRQ